MKNGFLKSVQFNLSILSLSLLLALPALGEKILNGKKRILIYPDDSHGAAAGINKVYLDRYFGGKDKSPFTITAVSGRHWPIGIDKDGNPSKTLLGSGTPTYLIDGKLKKKIAEAKSGCSGCKVVFTAYGHGISRQLPNGKIVAPNDGFFITDSTDQEQINRAVEWGKFLADELLAMGVDYVILSSGTVSLAYNRLIDQMPPVVRAFNEKYGSQNMYWADAVTHTSGKYYLTRMGGDINHPNPFIGNSNFYAQEYFRSMLKMDGEAIPEWIEEHILTKEKELVNNYRKVKYTGPDKGHYALGDVIPFKWEVNCSDIGNKAVVPNFIWWRRDGALDKLFANSTRVRIFPWSDRCPTAGGADGKRQGSWCCGQDYPSHGLTWGHVDVKVTKELIALLLTGKSGAKNIDAAFSRMKQPFPIFAQIGKSEVYRPDWDASNIDWGNPENMIVIHPFESKRMDLPVYPQGFKDDGTVAIGEKASYFNEPKAELQKQGVEFFWRNGHQFWNVMGQKQIPNYRLKVE